MKTHVTKVKEISRQWYLIDADGQVLGRLSTAVADILRGKNKPYFSPSVDCGDYVVIINTAKVKVTGNKMADKKYYRHSGYPGGIKEESLEKALSRDPNMVIYHAIRGMLPKNKLSDKMLDKLKLFPDENHHHEAQKPQKIDIGEKV